MTELLKVHEVAQTLRVHNVTVRRWIREGTLPAMKVGRDWRIRSQDVEALLTDSTEAVS